MRNPICGGALLCCYITKPERTAGGFKDYVKVPPRIGRTIGVCSSLPPRVEPEITEPMLWQLSFFIPFALFEHYQGRLGEVGGQVWRGNFFKCAEENSHPQGPPGRRWTSSTSTARIASGIFALCENSVLALIPSYVASTRHLRPKSIRARSCPTGPGPVKL